MTRCFAYKRVSTVKQGEQGVSLQEQEAAIRAYAARHGHEIVDWFEERVTAAKRGRPEFTKMLRLLRNGKAEGVIIHKIDRGARNLRDWAELGDLVDAGIELHSTSDSLDFASRGGRLSADIQAVVAADYIRNLREETRKGFYGRLKQGYFPLPAPIGYQDQGKAKPKTIDPVSGPLVRQAFKLYATGSWSLRDLAEELHRRGLRNKRGGRVRATGLNYLLRNPFYIGLMRIGTTGETFEGSHEPLVTKALFDRVQATLSGKAVGRTVRHNFAYRRLFNCAHCGYSLVGERQKGHIYYRCHTKACPTKSVRQHRIEEVVRRELNRIVFTPKEMEYLRNRLEALRESATTEGEEAHLAIKRDLGALQGRLARLTTAYVDGEVDKETFLVTKQALLEERLAKEESRVAITANPSLYVDSAAEILELAGAASLSYTEANDDQKRRLIQQTTSNRTLMGRELSVELSFPFTVIASSTCVQSGPPNQDRPRTASKLDYSRLNSILQEILHWVKREQPASVASPLDSAPRGVEERSRAWSSRRP